MSYLISLGIFVGMGLAIFLFIYFVNICENHLHFNFHSNRDCARVDFQTFYSWYLLNPKRYSLYDYYFSVDTSTPNNPDFEQVCFTNYREWKKYSQFLRNKQAAGNTATSQQTLLKIQTFVQSDNNMARMGYTHNMSKIASTMAGCSSDSVSQSN